MNVFSKITKTIVVSFLIGLLIGGLTIGLLDANRPRPLFSSASPQECQYLVINYNQVVAEMNIRPYNDRARWDELNESLGVILDDIRSCSEPICDPIWDQIADAAQQMEGWRVTLDSLTQDIDAFVSSNPQPWSPEQTAQFESLIEQQFNAEEQMQFYGELRESTSHLYYEESGCGAHDDLDRVDPYEQIDSGSGGDIEAGSY